MDKNTQQQASWEYFDGTWHVGVDGERENYEMFGYPTRDLYTARPVPRDVLMAFGEELWNNATPTSRHACRMPGIAALADRYASQVQPEPEPVNQQTLAALKLAKNSLVAFKLMPGQSNAWEEHDEANLVAINAAIAAAEASGQVVQQYDHIVDAAKMVHAVPVAIDRATIRQIFMAHGFTIKEGQTDLKPYVYEAAEALLRAQQPASAQPVAVPECPYPCGWQQLHKLAVEDGAYLARAIDEDEPVTSNARDTTMRVVGNLIAVTRAMLSAAPKPEGV